MVKISTESQVEIVKSEGQMEMDYQDEMDDHLENSEDVDHIDAISNMKSVWCYLKQEAMPSLQYFYVSYLENEGHKEGAYGVAIGCLKWLGQNL